jgi:ABC-2 type transport system permease protein
MWRRIMALMKKEFLAILKDKKSRIVLIGPPIIQLLVFGYAATYDLSQVPFAIYNEDQGSAARDLLAGVRLSPTFHEVARVTRDDQIAPLIDSRKALLLIHFGPDFSRNLTQGTAAPLQVIVDGRNSNTAMIALNYIQSIVDAFNQEWTSAQQRGTPRAYLVTRAWFNPNLESRWFIVPGIIGLLTLVVTMLVTALSVAREREQGTFDQLLVTPMRPTEIVLGKALPGFIIGFAEATLIILVAVHWFHVPLLGHLATLYMGLFLFLLSAIGVGLMISSISLTQQQGLLGAFLFLVPSIILSGFTTPIANMPQAVQYLTYINPLRYFMVVLREVFLQGTPFLSLLDQFWPMALIGIVNLSVAGWLFRHRMN